MSKLLPTLFGQTTPFAPELQAPRNKERGTEERARNTREAKCQKGGKGKGESELKELKYQQRTISLVTY